MNEARVLADRMLRLEARVWAQLVRWLKNATDLPPTVAAAVAVPAGELATSAGRRVLCEAMAAEKDLHATMRDDVTLPAAIHQLLIVDDEASRDVSERRPESAVPVDAQAADRLRELRRARDDDRRRLEGAEVRAAAAAAQSEKTRVELEHARARIDALERELAASREETRRAVARAERRSSSQVDALERDLANERSSHAAARREHDRVVAELAALQKELARVRAEQRTVPRTSPVQHGRPLVLPPSHTGGTTAAAKWLAERAQVLLVDGYNAALLLRPDRPLEEQRRWLIERMRPLAVREVPHPVVVFDGDRSSGQSSNTGGVEVRFTTGGVLADDEIVFSVAATDAPVLVVTDDVELRERVTAEGGNVVGVVHLLGIIDG